MAQSRHGLLPVVLVVSATLAPGGSVGGVAAKAADSEKGQVVRKHVRYGEYVQYVPRQEARGVLVVVHGMPTEEDARHIVALAEKFLKRWVAFAEVHRLVVLAPAFDDENFGSLKGEQGGGYRGLFGRQVGADEFVNLILEQSRSYVRSWDGRIVLYGHSAGAQFANRYCVRHPDRVRAAVISAAGWYAMPDAKAHWPSGMGPWKTSFRWASYEKPQPIDVRPDPSGWQRAAVLPLTVVVGTADTEEQKPRAGHTGTTRVEYAQQWVKDMNQLAKDDNRAGRVRLILVEGVGHDSARLTPTAQRVLAEALNAK
jgi:poly(3-hydroxybutyrate) depolymerase